MTNEQTDFNVHQLIHNRLANTTKSIISTSHLDDRVVDNSLRRLKSAGKVKFDKEGTKRWVSLSQPSALPTEGVERSEGTTPSGDAGQDTQGNNNMDPKEDKTGSVADIDEAIAKARKNKGSKPASEQVAGKRPRLSDEEKKARDEKREADKAARKAEREAAKAAKAAQRAEQRPAAHMSKVAKAASRLPKMNQTAESIFNDCTANLGVAEITALAAHLLHFNRTKATERALSQKVGQGDTVKILSGNDKYVGQTGVVTKAQRIRCYVSVEGAKKDVYLFTSDVEVVKSAAKTAANG